VKILALPYYSQHGLFASKVGCGGAKLFTPPYYSQRAVFASLSEPFFVLTVCLNVNLSPVCQPDIFGLCNVTENQLAFTFAYYFARAAQSVYLEV